MRFCVIADAHLGYRQHGLEERRDDFLKAFWQCIGHSVDFGASFLIIAGDLFHTRYPDWYDINEVSRAFRYLSENMDVVAIRGNHDTPSYTDRIGWTDFFYHSHLINELPYEYYTFKDRKRYNVHGLHWEPDINEKLIKYQIHNHNESHFNILVLHGSVDNIMYHSKGQVSMETLNSVKDKFNMVFLGHIHKPYSIDNWIFSPGSLENVSVAELQWPERGMLCIEVDDNTFEYKVETFVPERREIVTYEIEVDNLETDLLSMRPNPGAMVFVNLVGDVLEPITTEQLNSIEEKIKIAKDALLVKIKNQTQLPTESKPLGQEISTDSAYKFVFGDKAQIAKNMKEAVLNKQRINLENL